MDADKLVDVYWPVDMLEADAIRQALGDEGILVHLDGENLTSWAGASPFGNMGRCRLRLMVRACDADCAKQIIEDGDWPNYVPK